MSEPEVVTLWYGELTLGVPLFGEALPANDAQIETLETLTQVPWRLFLSLTSADGDVSEWLPLLSGDQIRLRDAAGDLAKYIQALVITTTEHVEFDYYEYTCIALEAGDPLTIGSSVYVNVPVPGPTPGPAGGSYATVEELARILLIPTPTAPQAAAMARVLNAAAAEITAYLGLEEALVEPYPDLVVEVNLERAVEHWKQEQSPFGIVVLGGELPPGHAGVNAWRRHARTLLPLKRSWGVS